MRRGKRARSGIDQSDLIRSLRSTLAKMELALSQLEDPIIFVDTHGRIEWCNEPFCQLIGRPRISILGVRLADVFPLRRDGELLTEDEHPAAVALASGEPLVDVLEYAPETSSPRQIRISGRSVAHSAERKQGAFVLRDVTAQGRELRQARLATLGALTSGMIHQIRSPLGFVRSNIEYLQANWAGSSDMEEVFSESLFGLDRIESLFKTATAFDQPTLDQFVEFDLADAIRAAARMAKGHWDTVAEVQIPPNRGDAPVIGDPSAIAQAFAALFTNAAWAVGARRKREGSEFRGRIEVSIAQLDGWSEMVVEDNGIGIAPEHVDRIFDPFFTTQSDTDALGQGLFVAKSILADQHGGMLRAEPRQGGARLVVRLPSYEPF